MACKKTHHQQMVRFGLKLCDIPILGFHSSSKCGLENGLFPQFGIVLFVFLSEQFPARQTGKRQDLACHMAAFCYILFFILCRITVQPLARCSTSFGTGVVRSNRTSSPLFFLWRNLWSMPRYLQNMIPKKQRT